MKSIVGERKITLGGKEYHLRPSFAALCEIESQTGKSVALVIRDSYPTPRYGDMAKVLFCLIQAGENKSPTPTLEEVWEMMREAGAGAAASDAMIALASAVTKGNEIAQEKKVQTTKPTKNRATKSTGRASTGSPSVDSV